MLNCLSSCLRFFNGYQQIQDEPQIPMTNTNPAITTDTKVRNSFVQFNDITRIVLIPSREDYKNYELTEDLWYNDSDYEGFKEYWRNKITKQTTLSSSPTSIQDRLSASDIQDSTPSSHSKLPNTLA